MKSSGEDEQKKIKKFCYGNLRVAHALECMKWNGMFVYMRSREELCSSGTINCAVSLEQLIFFFNSGINLGLCFGVVCVKSAPSQQGMSSVVHDAG